MGRRKHVQRAAVLMGSTRVLCHPVSPACCKPAGHLAVFITWPPPNVNPLRFGCLPPPLVAPAGHLAFFITHSQRKPNSQPTMHVLSFFPAGHLAFFITQYSQDHDLLIERFNALK